MIGVASGSVAFASPGQTSWTTYLRAGPGMEYAVIDEVANRQALDVQGCAAGWCRVAFGDTIGYVAAEVIVQGEPTAPANPASGSRSACFETEQAGYPRGEQTRFCPR